ncbi:BREX-1 system phosphatase PglZ type A [Clostridium autoethanogenum]|uniref:BREX-1 system phosphatase PglZ type A n=1 Tax=Clostridium autoethanogenum TaxID=84023 RepID=A0A3M0S3D9_9CLOT|nr:BREX-1 system phosphatase PglZ type A [Clostridium autoethanogenum]RMC93038.1 BREX-1 system phosphatase PglZ type A [Clostridium autoethanogenum]
MNLTEIQNKINTLLDGTERKIVFWYDDDAEYQEDIQNIVLSEENKLHILTQDNWFETKLLLEVRDTESNYLIYAPFKRPDDRKNHLADTFYYSEHFYSDKIVQLCGDLGIPTNCQDTVKKYKRFWTSRNTQKFKDLQISEYSKSAIELGIMCVVASVKVLSFDELLRKVILSENNGENPVLKKMQYYKIHIFFWNMCKNQYGYEDDNPSVMRLMVTMLLTYAETLTEYNLPKEWKTFVSDKHNDNVVFIKNMMNNSETCNCYDKFADMISYELKAENAIKSIPLQYIVGCDVFEAFDQNIISWVSSKIKDDMLDEKIADMFIPDICKMRIKDSYHYSKKYKAQYLMLLYAYRLLKQVYLYEFKPTMKEVIDDYVKETYKIDTYYRKFYYYMDKTGLPEGFEEIKDLVENVYTNKYLSGLTYKWNQILTDEAYQTYPYTKEEDFYHEVVRAYINEGHTNNNKVIVIISDGMRFECARELMEDLSLDEKCDANIGHMLSVLPSETTLGMASLLPHKDIVVDENLGVTVDGMICGNSIAERDKVLKNTVPNSVCLQFDDVINAKTMEVRDMIQGKDLIYIYHNQIDNRGEKMGIENEVFNACAETIDEIHRMLIKLTNDVSCTRYIITADHGFIYKREKLEESDKIVMDKKKVSLVNKRFLLTLQKVNNDATTSRALTYLSKLNELYVTTPKGADIIKAPGGGQNYVHGGSSLQEMIVPVIKVRTAKGKQKTGFVNVELSSFNNRITSIEMKLDFMQMEPVTDVVKGRKLLAFFIDEDGNKISYDVPIIANSRDTNASNRLITEKFTLKSGKYNRKKDYYLVITDMDDERIELHRYKFEIDIAGTI